MNLFIQISFWKRIIKKISNKISFIDNENVKSFLFQIKTQKKWHFNQIHFTIVRNHAF